MQKAKQTVEEVEAAFQELEAVFQELAFGRPSAVLLAINEMHVSIYKL